MPTTENAATGGKVKDLWLYTSIGEFFGGETAEGFRKKLEALGKPNEIRLFINSDGGDVFQGVSIYNMLVRHPAKITVFIDGIAASIASLIAMAGASITMAANGFMMVHEPWWGGHGTAADLRKQAETLDKVRAQLIDTYARRTGMDTGKISDLLAAETWMDSAEALSMGFVQSVQPLAAVGASAKYDLTRFRNAPAAAVRPLQPTQAAIRLRAKHGTLFPVIQSPVIEGSV